MHWFAQRGHAVTGIDKDLGAAQANACPGTLVCADIENGSWPLYNGELPQTFGAVVVTNYLWRPLLPLLIKSVAPNGVLLYETFAQGNESVGRPTRADFLLQPGELLGACRDLHIVAYENGVLEQPTRFVQRIAAIRTTPASVNSTQPARYPL